MFMGQAKSVLYDDLVEKANDYPFNTNVASLIFALQYAKVSKLPLSCLVFNL